MGAHLIRDARTLRRRGDDASGIWLKEQIGLSHARLSIRDIEHGSQPMIRSRNGRTCAIVHNGEIYNTDELIPPLREAAIPLIPLRTLRLFCTPICITANSLSLC